MKNKNLILLIIIALVIGSIYYLENQKVSVSAENSGPLELVGDFPKAPELQGIFGYLNTEGPIKIADYKGKVVLIDFWTYSCINCIRTLPHITTWHEKYKDDGLVIIGVHTPEFEFEKDKGNVQTALEKYDIKYAVVQDNEYGTWKAFQNRYWPHKFLIDKDGLIRYDHIGEGGYAETEAKIQQLLAEIKPDMPKKDLTNIPDTTPKRAQTPELYAGYEFALPRGQDIGNEGGLQGGIEEYSFDGALNHDRIFLKGLWQSNKDNLEAKGPASIFLGYTSSAVNIVANGGDMEIWLNGKRVTAENAGDAVKDSIARVIEPDLYNVVRSDYGTYILELRVEEGFTFNAFTFG
jgi:thiol-disulfide isomerase/thioredoxin